MISANRSLVFSILILGILGFGEVASTKKGKGRRFQQRPLAPAYQTAAFHVPPPQIPTYYTPPSSYVTPPVLRQSSVRPIGPRPGIVVFGVGPNSLQIPNQYINYGGVAQYTNAIVPRPAQYAYPVNTITKTATRIQLPAPKYTQPAASQQNIKQTGYLSKPIQPVYPVQLQYGNKFPVAQSEYFQQTSRPAVFVPAPVTAPKLPDNVPTYVAPAKSTVYASAYVGNTASYSASDAYTRGEVSKPAGSDPVPYQSPASQPHKTRWTTPSTLYSSKTANSYNETKAEQSTKAYVKQITQVKGNQYHSPTPTLKVKYVTNLPYSTPEPKTISDSYGKLYHSGKPNADKHHSNVPIYPVSQFYKETESLSYGEKKEGDSSILPFSKVETNPANPSFTQNVYKELAQEEGKIKTPVYLASQSHEKEETQQEKKLQVFDYVPSSLLSKSESITVSEFHQANSKSEKYIVNQYKAKSSVNSTTPSYREASSVSFRENSKEVDHPSLPYSKMGVNSAGQPSNPNEYKLLEQEESEMKGSIYLEYPSHKKIDLKEEKKKQVPVYVPNRPPLKTEPTTLDESYKKSDADKNKQQTSVYLSTQSYKGVNSQSYGEEKKNVDATSHPYIAVEAKKVFESSKQTGYQQSTENKKEVSIYPASKDYEEVTSTKYVKDYKQQNSSVYGPTSDRNYKATTASYEKLSHPTKGAANKDQLQNPVQPDSHSYKEAEALSYNQKKEGDSLTLPYYEEKTNPASQSFKKNVYEGATQEETRVKTPVYPLSHSHKKEERQHEKKEQIPDYVPNPPASKAEPTPVGESYPQINANDNKKHASVYPTTPSNKEVDSQSYGEKKKNVDASSYPYIAVEAKIIESLKQTGYQQSTEGKKEVAIHPTSQEYKDVESPTNVKDYKQQNPAVYEPISVDDSYSKTSHEQSYVKEIQPKVVPSTDSYKKIESKFEDKTQRFNTEPVPHKPTTVRADPNYDSILAATQESLKYHETKPETYESNYPSASTAPKFPTKKVNSVSKTTSVESNDYSLPVYSATTVFPTYRYSTGYTTTSERSTTPAQGNSKIYHETTSKYQDSSSSPSVATRDYPVYKSTMAFKYIQGATTPTQIEDDYNQNPTNKYVNIKTDARVAVETSYGSQTTTTNYNVKANDRIYAVADQDEFVEFYEKTESSVAYQTYKSSVDEKSSEVDQVVNQYAPTDSDYSSALVGTDKYFKYNGEAVASSAAYPSTYNGKPIEIVGSLSTALESAKLSGIYHNDGVEGDYSAIPGKPEIDYPIFSELPNDKFNCSEQRLPGYYADTSARCQVFHICLGDRQWSFLCPNGTIFSQQHFVCVWWYEFDCSKATSLYNVNEKLFIIPSTKQNLVQQDEQYAKTLAGETSMEKDKQYYASLNKGEKTSSAY